MRMATVSKTAFGNGAPRLVAIVASLALLVAACGSDEEVSTPTVESDPDIQATTQDGEATTSDAGPQPPDDEVANGAEDEAKDSVDPDSGSDEPGSDNSSAQLAEPAESAEPEDTAGLGDDPMVDLPENATEVDCSDLLVVQGLTPPNVDDFHCLLITVPVDHNNPTEGTTDISVALLPGEGDPSLPALAVLNGGPGGASTEMTVVHERQNYDLVFIDQRGTGFGSVDFVCSEFGDRFRELLQLSSQEQNDALTEMFNRCVADWSEEPAFIHTNTPQMARDVAAVMAALAHDRWVVYGLSYGTTIAQELLRSAPNELIGAILDGTLPVDVDFDSDVARAADQALVELQASCIERPGCLVTLAMGGSENATITELVSNAIERLNEEPVTVSLGPADTSLGEGFDVLFDGDAAAGVLFNALYFELFLPALPVVLAGLQTGSDSTLGEAALSTLGAFAVELANANTEQSHGTYFRVLCTDFLPGVSGVQDDVGDFGAVFVGEGLPALCEEFSEMPEMPNVTSGGTPAEPVATDLPVLFLSGQFDPVTPPSFATQVAELMPAATLIELSGGSHGQWAPWLGFGTCVDDMIGSFVVDPAGFAVPDCASEENSPW